MNKGPNSLNSYMVIIKKETVNQLNLKKGDAFLIKLFDEIFPVVLRPNYSRNNSMMLGFTIPRKIGKKLKSKQKYSFNIISKAIKRRSIAKKEYIGFQNIIPEKTLIGSKIYLFKFKSKLLVWIYSKGNKLIEFPNDIPFEKNGYNIFEFTGAFFCEGFKARKNNKNLDRFSFSNTEKSEIIWFIDAVEILLGINKSLWSVEIQTDNIKQNLINYWSQCGFSQKNIRLQYNKKVKAKYGVCVVNIYNSSLAESIYFLIEHCKTLLLKNKKNAICFFRGVSRGDMGVTSNRFSKYVSFSAKGKQNAILFNNVCNLLKIKNIIYKDKRREDFWNVFISTYDDFKKIVNLGGIVHQKRQFRLYNLVFKSMKSNHYKYLKSVSLGYSTTRKSAEFLNLSIITSRQNFAKLKKLGYLKSKSDYKIPNKLVYTLTPRGDKELNFYKYIENYINNAENGKKN